MQRSNVWSVARWEDYLADMHLARLIVPTQATTQLQSRGWGQDFPLTPPERAVCVLTVSWVCRCCHQGIRVTETLFTTNDGQLPCPHSSVSRNCHTLSQSTRPCPAEVWTHIAYPGKQADPALPWYMQVSQATPQSVEVWQLVPRS